MSGPAALIDPDGLTLPWAGVAQPYGLVDLDCAPRTDATLHLPPFPLLGIGDPTHSLAPRLDALIELPVSLGAITQQIMAQPEAARVLVQLLRLIDGLDPAQALVAESLAYGLLQGSAGHARWLAAQMPAPLRAAPQSAARSHRATPAVRPAHQAATQAGESGRRSPARERTAGATAHR